MSLEFNRRSFLKYTAVAAVAVAGSSLLTGCGEDSYQPTGRIGDTLTLMGKQTMYGVEESTAHDVSKIEANKLTCAMKFNNTAKWGNSVTNDDFEIEVTSKASNNTTLLYHAGNTDGTGGLSLSKQTNYLATDASFSTVLTLVPSTAFGDGDTIKVKYWPKKNGSEGTYAYTRAYCTWSITVYTDDDGNLSLK